MPASGHDRESNVCILLAAAAAAAAAGGASVARANLGGRSHGRSSDKQSVFVFDITSGEMSARDAVLFDFSSREMDAREKCPHKCAYFGLSCTINSIPGVFA